MGHFTYYAATLMTTLGILGTFAGIVIGLMHFDVNNIDGSISQLLSGLKVAFVTSLVGMALAILYKIFEGIFHDIKSKNEMQSDEIGIENLYEVLIRQNENLALMQKILGQNDESSLMGQIKLMRSDMRQRHEEAIQKLSRLDAIQKIVEDQVQSFERFSDTLWIKLQDFTDMLSKSATEQVIEALNQVIRDFNNQLNEQFGENFKALNDAVGRLVEWQENYKVQLMELKTAYEQSVEGIQKSRKALEDIDRNTANIPNHLTQLENVLRVNQHQIDELARHLNAFKELRDKAIEAIPQIDEKIEKTLDGVNVASTKLVEGINESVKDVANIISHGTQEFQHGVMVSTGALQNAADGINKTNIQMQEQLDSAIVEINNKLRALVEGLIDDTKQLNSNFQEVGTTLTNDLSHFSRHFETELKKIATHLQSQMEESVEVQIKEVQKLFHKLESTIENVLKTTGDGVQKQVDMIDQVAQQEIQNIMEAMGQALTTITGQFTKDYRQLVQEMKQITTAHR